MFGFRKDMAMLREENQTLRERLDRLEAAIGAEMPMLRERIDKLEAAQTPAPESAEHLDKAAEQERLFQEGVANILGYSLESLRQNKGVLTDG